MSVPATVVANSFVKQYYGILAQTPEQLYKFYKAQSVFSFSRGAQGGGQTSTVSAVGQEEIRAKITATLRPFNGHFCKAEIIGIDSQESRQGGVLVLVTGYLVISGTAATQHFTQSFFLDKQTTPYEGYFVLNDILRYLPPTAATATTTLPRPATPQSPSAESPTRTPAAAPPGAPPPQVHPSMLQPLQRPQGQESPSLASWLYQAEQQMPAVSAAQDIPDGEVDERVAEVSLDIEDEEEEEERPQDEELEEDAADEEEAEAAQEEETPAHPAQEEQLQHPPEEVAEEPVPQAPEEATEEAVETAEEAAEAEAEEEGQEEEQEQVEAAPPAEEQEGWAKIDEAAASTERLDGESLASYFLVEEAPRTWASLAGRLQEGGGQLRPSKVQGYACPAASRATQSYPQHTASGTAAAGAGSGYAGSQQRAGKGGGTSSSSRPPLASSHVWLWVSRLPSDPAAESQEVLDSLNSFLVEWGCDGRAVEVDRRDPQQEWASIQVTNQEAADTLLALSKDRGLLLRGKPLKADLHRFTFGPRRQGRGGGGDGRGAARGGGGVSGSGREDDRHDGGGKAGESGGKAGESRGGGRPRRKPRGPMDGRDRFSGGNSSGSYSEFGAKGYGKK